jgi:hypothetical protein
MALPVRVDLPQPSWGSFPGFSRIQPSTSGLEAFLPQGQPGSTGFGLDDEYARQLRSLNMGSMSSGTNFNMPSSSEMAELLKDLMAKGIGRKDQAGGQTPGMDLGQLMQAFMQVASMLSSMSQAGQQQGGQSQGQNQARDSNVSRGITNDPGQQRSDQTRQRTSDASRTPRDQPDRTRADDHAGHTHGPSSTQGIPRGLSPNAARGAEEARRLGFNGTIHGIRPRNGPRDTSDHPSGRAIDIMTNNNRQQGRQLAEHFRANHERLGVKYVIFEQQIASARSGWQWRNMADRGNPTANHMDHPHISFY